MAFYTSTTNALHPLGYFLMIKEQRGRSLEAEVEAVPSFL
jgi:hypothetical protein